MSWVGYKVIKAIKLQAGLQAGKGTTEKRAGRMACSAEAFFCLDFFWYFFVSRQKRTSLRGNERARVRSEPKVPALPVNLPTCHDSEARQSRTLQSSFARKRRPPACMEAELVQHPFAIATRSFLCSQCTQSIKLS